MKLSDLENNIEKWFDIPEVNVAVQLRLPNRDELARVYKACVKKDKQGNDIINETAWYIQVAKLFILDVKGLTDDSGKPVAYTPEVGFSMMKNQIIGSFIDKMLTTASEWVELGKE